MHHLLHIVQAMKTESGGGGGVWERGCESRNAGLVPRLYEIIVMVKLRLVSCPDPLTLEQAD